MNISSRPIKVSISLIALVVGSLIYIVFRSKSLLMFQWFDAIHLTSAINQLRNNFSQVPIYSWIEFNMPAGLWLLSYLYIIDAIWGKEYMYLKRAFLLMLPILALSSEFLQLVKILPGTFDIFDVLCYILAITLYNIIK